MDVRMREENTLGWFRRDRNKYFMKEALFEESLC